ncbi:hypothetical protein [Microbacterium esteraromaticum]|nr:hypothetical protein [Microbacterium esteraromaticum]
MRHRTSLPTRLGSTFAIGDAAAAGVTRWRRDTPDLHRPFRGVRTLEAPTTFARRIECYQPRMKPGHRFVGRTAARIWGLPLPQKWSIDEKVEVAVPHDRTPPGSRGVKGRRLSLHLAQTHRIGRIRVVDPLAAVLTCARELTEDQAVVMLDALLTPADNYPDLLVGRPVYTIAEIEDRIAAWRRFPGRETIRAALRRARPRVESPKETETRLLITRAGLPEPVIQYDITDRDRVIARADLAYPALKIAIEYEGDGHRSSRDQWRRDIQRHRDLEDRGWIVIRLTQLDLDDGAASALSRIRRALLSRSS